VWLGDINSYILILGLGIWSPDQNFLTEQPEELELGSMWLLVLSYTQMEMELWEDQMSPRI